ncbi:MAG: fatty acid desaturase family protein [Methylococcales bacterium]
MSNRKVVFANVPPSDFTREVKTGVAAYFRDRGIRDKANGAMVAKTLILATMTFGSYALILSNQFRPTAMLILAVIMGIGFAGLGFAIHDAIHGAFSANPRINRLLAITYDIMGASRYLWKITHNGIHHTFTNVMDIDEDIRVIDPMVRLSPGSPRFWHHRFQHIYTWVLYTLATINWILVKDYRYMFLPDLGPYHNPRRPTKIILDMFAFKLINLTWTLVIPLIVIDLPWQQILLGYLVMNMVAGFILGVVFQMAHVVEPAEFVEADRNSRVEDEWFLHQMRTTANFATSNRLLTLYVGGLNHQVEHHLFPMVCSIHYPAIRKIVQDAAHRHGVVYHCFPTFSAALASHYRLLKHLGCADGLENIHHRVGPARPKQSKPPGVTRGACRT